MLLKHLSTLHGLAPCLHGEAHSGWAPFQRPCEQTVFSLEESGTKNIKKMVLFWGHINIAQSVMCLSYKHEDLSLASQLVLMQKPDMVVDMCIPTTSKDGAVVWDEGKQIPRAHCLVSLASW